jgi:hypothetical protein
MRLLLIIIQKFIHAPPSSKSFILLVNFIHVDVVFIHHNYFGIDSIHAFQHVKYFIQKVLDVQLSSKLFIHFVTFIHYMWKNIFHIVPTWHKDILIIFFPHHQNIPKISILNHMPMFISSHSRSRAHFVTSLISISTWNLKDLNIFFNLIGNRFLNVHTWINDCIAYMKMREIHMIMLMWIPFWSGG